MGIITGGILGGFRNKTGSVVGSYWRRLDIIKGLPRKSGKAPTQRQLNQQSRFGITTSVLKWITPLIEVGFKSVAKISTPMNVAVGYHLKEAIAGVAPDFSFDYTKLAFSVGSLMLPVNLTVSGVVAGTLDFAWEDDRKDNVRLNETDMASFLVYNIEKDEFAIYMDVAPRSAKAYTLTLPNHFSGDNCHCYVAFHSVLRTELCSSTHHFGSLPVL